MIRRNSTMRGLFGLLFVGLLLSLTACELPAQREEPIQLDESVQSQPPITDPNLQTGVDPQAQPGEGGQPAGTDGYPAPGADGSTVITTTTGTEVIVAPGGEGGQQPPAEQPAEAPAAEAPPDGVYIVQAGDTLGQIAQRFGVSIQDIAVANNLINVDALDIGQELTIPEAGFAEQAQPAGSVGGAGERVHIVQRGENLYRIGLVYGFTVDELQAYNNLPNPNALDVGQEILIPPDG